MVTSEHHRDEDARHLIRAEPQGTLLIPDRHQDVQEVSILLRWRRRRLPLVHDLLDERDEIESGCISHSERLDVGVGVDEGERIGALLEVVVEIGEASIELQAEAATDQAR